MESQIATIIALQQHSGLKTLLSIFSFLGNEEFFLLLIPLIYLCIDARTGLRLGLLVLFGDMLNCLFKLAFHLPRPYQLDTRIQPLATDPSFGMPSSHAQNAVSVWLFLAGRSRRAWAWGLAVCVILLISLARVYLGVHFITDILGGWVIGALFLGIFLKLEPKLSARFERSELKTQVIVFTAIAFVILLLGTLFAGVATNVDTVAAAEGLKAVYARAGAIFGLGIGWALMLRYAPFSAGGPAGQRVARFVIALVVLLILWKGLDKVFPSEPQGVALLFRFIRYALMTFWVVFVAPLLFLKLNLASPLDSRPETELTGSPMTGVTA